MLLVALCFQFFFYDKQRYRAFCFRDGVNLAHLFLESCKCIDEEKKYKTFNLNGHVKGSEKSIYPKLSKFRYTSIVEALFNTLFGKSVNCFV